MKLQITQHFFSWKDWKDLNEIKNFNNDVPKSICEIYFVVLNRYVSEICNVFQPFPPCGTQLTNKNIWETPR